MRNGSVPEIVLHHRFVPDRRHESKSSTDALGRRYAEFRRPRHHPDGYPSARLAVTLSMLFWPVCAALIFLVLKLI